MPIDSKDSLDSPAVTVGVSSSFSRLIDTVLEASKHSQSRQGQSSNEKGMSEKGKEMLEKFSEGGELERYLQDKPTLFKNEESISVDDIEYVSNDYVASTGRVLSYWYDLLEVKTNDGKTYLVDQDISPELYAKALAAEEAGDAESLDYQWSDADIPESEKDWLNTKSNKGFKVIEPQSEVTLPTSLGDIAYASNDVETDVSTGLQITQRDIDSYMAESGVITYEDNDGKRYAVSEEYTPQAYKQIKNLKDVWDGIQDKIVDGEYKLLDGGDDIPVLSGNDEVENVLDDSGSLVEGIKLIHKDGETTVVLESSTPQHFETITAYAADKHRGEAEDPFRERDLPLSTETDLMSAETTEEEDDETLSVGDLFMKNLEDKRDNTDDEKLKSKLDKYIRLMELKSDLDNGIEFLPYQTVDVAGSDRTDYADSSQLMSESDVRGLIDEQALSEELEGLLGDEKFAELSEKLMSEATDKLKDKDALVDRIYDSMTGEKGDDYLLAMKALDDDGLKQQAQDRMNNDLSVLTTLAPAKAEEAQNQITAKSMAMDVGSAMDDIDDEYESGNISTDSEQRAEQVASDLVKPMLTSIIYANFGLQASTKVWMAVNALKAGGKVTPSDLANLNDQEKAQFNKIKIVKDVLTDALKNEALKGTKAGKLDMDDISDRVDKVVKEADIKDSEKVSKEVKSGFKTLIDREATFAIGGMVALANAIYRRSEDGFGDSAEERMAVARGILVFIGCTPGTLTTLDLAGNGFKSLFGQKGMIEALGLDKELYETFQKNTGTKEEFTPDPRVEAQKQIDEGWSKISAILDNDEALNDEEKKKAKESILEIRSGLSDQRDLINANSNIGGEERQQQLEQTERVDDRLSAIWEEVSDENYAQAREAFSKIDEERASVNKIVQLYSQNSTILVEVEQLRAKRSLEGKLNDTDKARLESLFDGFKENITELEDRIENAPFMDDALRQDYHDGLKGDGKAIGRIIAADRDTAQTLELIESLKDKTSNDISDLNPLSDSAPNGGRGENGVFDAFHQNLDNASAASRGDVDAITPAPLGSEIPEVRDVEGINDNVSDTPTPTPTDTDKTNLFGPVLKGIAYMTDFAGGILDIAVAGMGLDAALKNGDALDKANASLGIVSGAGFTIGGAAEVAGTTISPSARLAPLRALGAVSRLGVVPGANLVGVLVGTVSLIIGLVISQRQNEQKEEEVRSDFQDLDKFGVMEGDWGEKLNFLIHTAAAFEGQEGAGKAPDHVYYDDGFYQSHKEIIDYIADHWDRKTPGDYIVDDGKSDDDEDSGSVGGLGGRLGQPGDVGDGMPTYGWTWSGNDDIVSKKDLERVVDKKIGTDMDQKAAKFLLDNEGFFGLLDTFHNGGSADGKASAADIDSWLQFIDERAVTEDNPVFEREQPSPHRKEFFSDDLPVWEAQSELYEAFTEEVENNGNIPENFFENHLDKMELQVHGAEFYKEHKKTIDTIAENWDDWNGGDDIVSKSDLEDVRDDEDKGQTEQDAAKFLLKDDKSDGFRRLLDVFHEGGDTDGKISDADLDSWFQIIGERDITEDNPVFEFEDDPLDHWLTDHKGP